MFLTCILFTAATLRLMFWFYHVKMGRHDWMRPNIFTLHTNKMENPAFFFYFNVVFLQKECQENTANGSVTRVTVDSMKV